MRRIISAFCCGVVLVGLAGCIATTKSRSVASLRRTYTDVNGELADVVDRTKQTVSKTWADMLHDWNYTEDDGFADIRSAAGH